MGRLALLVLCVAAALPARAAAAFTCAPEDDLKTCAALGGLFAATNGVGWVIQKREAHWAWTSVAPVAWSAAANGEEARGFVPCASSSSSASSPSSTPLRVFTACARAGTATGYCTFEGVSCRSNAVVFLCAQREGCHVR